MQKQRAVQYLNEAAVVLFQRVGRGSNKQAAESGSIFASVGISKIIGWKKWPTNTSTATKDEDRKYVQTVLRIP